MSDPIIYFNSSMPRSGSTLLQNILAQNPRFYCSPTSGVIALIDSAYTQFGDLDAFKAQNPDLMWKGFCGFCRGGMQGFYRAITDKPAVIDKNRVWVLYYEWLNEIFPKPKVFILVRDLRAILASMEKLYRRNKHHDRGREGEPAKGMGMLTVGNRVVHWMNTNPVGVSTMGLVDAIQKGVIRHCHVIRFEDLTTHPKPVLQRLYEYLEEPYFEHDFENVEQKTEENDGAFAIYGDHSIRSKVAPPPLDYWDLLGKDVAATVVRNFPLFYSTFYPDKR